MSNSTNDGEMPNVFSRHSLLGKSQELRSKLSEQKPLLGPLCLSGEATVFYAQYNTGKTLIALGLLVLAAQSRNFAPLGTTFINADDNAFGVVEKLEIAEDIQIEMVVPGHRDFQMDQLMARLEDACVDGSANGLFVIIDTLKKATDLMDKRSVARFTKVVRLFTMHGGTLLGLAHTNKHLNSNGQPVPEGTGDILNDFDAGYIVEAKEAEGEGGLRLVTFRNVKRRGDTPEIARFTYDASAGLTYLERVLSVRVIEHDDDLEYSEAHRPKGLEEAIVEAIELTIIHASSPVSKMDLISCASMAEKVSRRRVQAVLEKYTGDDIGTCKWNFTRGERGRMTYHMIKKRLRVAPKIPLGD